MMLSRRTRMASRWLIRAVFALGLSAPRAPAQSAAAGDLSLQQAGAKIVGAAAETDQNLPPGRYARFVDGCHGFYRDPANARLRSSHSSAWCHCLGEKYQRSMGREEEGYYANDFRGRFLNQSAQPTKSTDSAWPRLHSAVADCGQ